MTVENKQILQEKLKNIFSPQANITNIPEAINDFTTKITDAVDVYVQAELKKILDALKTPGAYVAPPIGGPCLPSEAITKL